MNKTIDKELLSRYVNGDFTADDRKYIERIFSDENCKDELQEFLQDDWATVNQDDHLEARDLDHILHKLYYQLKHQPKAKKDGRLRTLWNTYAKVAAVLLFPLALAYSIYTQMEILNIDAQVSYAEINAPLGSRVSFSLPDGSIGWLNSGSTLKYPVSFKNTRNVELLGEAYFDIQKNENKPFIVQTSSLNISVLGTQFNVAAYEDDNSIDVVLESGSVRLIHPGNEKSVEMKPNDRIEFDTDQKVMKKFVVVPEKYSSWKEGKLIFRNDHIDEVAKRLSRWYNVDIVINQTSKTDFRLRATFEDEEIEEVLKLIKMTFPIDYEIEKRSKDLDGRFKKRKIVINIK